MFGDFHSEVFSWIRGALLVLFVINATVYLQNRKRLFLYYSLYLLFVFIYFLKPVAPSALKSFYKLFDYSFLYLSFAFYIDFARVLISTKTKLPRWDWFFILERRALLIFSISIPIIQYLWGMEVYYAIIFLFSTIFTVFSIIAYFAISSIKGRNVEYFIIGSLSFVLLGNVSTYSKIIYGHEEMLALGIEPMIFTYVGALIEALVFTYIMGRIFKEIEEKKIDFKLQYVLKQKESAELKMTALRSQMNPHFLFNSLNSINSFILKNKPEEASDYITSFSKLIRKILKNSENMSISLEEELEVLETYVELEKTRVQGGFDFILTIDENLVLQDIKVPPLFLQPFIENSIWHGLVDKIGSKKIELKLMREGAYLIIKIRDNGIGLKKSLSQKNKMDSKRKFFGTEATEKRIKLLHDNNGVLIELKDISKGSITGTLVCLKFPIKSLY